MKRLGIALLAGVVSVVMVVPAWARSIPTEGGSINIPDLTSTSYDSIIKSGVSEWRVENDKEIFDADVHSVYTFADGAVEVMGECVAKNFDIVISPNGRYTKERYFARSVGDIGYLEGFIVQGLRQWALAYAPMGGVDLLAYDGTGHTCTVKVNGAQKTLKVVTEGEQSIDTVRVLNWYDFKVSLTEEWQKTALKRYTDYVAGDDKAYGSISIVEMDIKDGVQNIRGETNELIMWQTTTEDSWTWSNILKEEVSASVGKLIGR